MKEAEEGQLRRDGCLSQAENQPHSQPQGNVWPCRLGRNPRRWLCSSEGRDCAANEAKRAAASVSLPRLDSPRECGRLGSPDDFVQIQLESELSFDLNSEIREDEEAGVRVVDVLELEEGRDALSRRVAGLPVLEEVEVLL